MPRVQNKRNVGECTKYIAFKVARGRIIRIPIKVKPIKMPFALHRTVQDVIDGDEGMSGSCGNVQCALREFDEGNIPKDIIKNMYMAQFGPTIAIFVTRLTKQGQPHSGVWADHNQGLWQDAFDKLGKLEVLKSGTADKTFNVLPPRKRIATGHTKTSAPKPRKTGVCKGALARARTHGVAVAA